MSEECIFCHRDPYHYVDIGVGFQAAAVNCCDLGVALYQYRDEGLAKVANRIEELEATLAEQIEWVKSLADDLIAAEGREARLKDKLAEAVEFIQDLTGCSWPYDEDAKRILAKLKGEQP